MIENLDGPLVDKGVGFLIAPEEMAGPLSVWESGCNLDVLDAADNGFRFKDSSSHNDAG
jgi:hypothetical protein